MCKPYEICGIPKDCVKDIVVKGDHNVAITKLGEVYYWPYKKVEDNSYLTSPVKLPIPMKVDIHKAACGLDFVLLISSNGHLFSFGKNTYG